MPFAYPPRFIGSTFEPIAIQISREGTPLETQGTTVTVTIIDADTKGTIIRDQPANPAAGIPGRWEYRFDATVFANMMRGALWSVQWKVTIGNYSAVSDVAPLPIRKPI